MKNQTVCAFSYTIFSATDRGMELPKDPKALRKYTNQTKA